MAPTEGRQGCQPGTAVGLPPRYPRPWTASFVVPVHLVEGRYKWGYPPFVYPTVFLSPVSGTDLVMHTSCSSSGGYRDHNGVQCHNHMLGAKPYCLNPSGVNGLDCAMFYVPRSPPTQYRLYGRWFLQVKRPNQHYQSTEGNATKDKPNNIHTHMHRE